MSFTSLLSPTVTTALKELQTKFGEARTSLVRIRADRVRLARTGWRPRPPAETKLIRSAMWTAENSAAKAAQDYDLESRFVPTESAYRELGKNLEKTQQIGQSARVFIRGIEIDEPRFPLQGRPVCGAFFDLALAIAHDPRTVIVLPKVDGYREARFWAEVGRAFEENLALPRGTLRFAITLETEGGIVEAEEILFELKDSIVGMIYDARLDRLDALRMASGSPMLPLEDPSADPWRGIEIISRREDLENLARRRGVALELRPSRTAASGEHAVFSLDSLHAKAGFAFRFLRAWFGGAATPEGKDWIDFDLARALLWTAIHSGFLREENYDAWREELGAQPFEAGSVSEAAIRTLDPLVRTGIFPDSSMPLAFSVLLEREKTHGVSDLRLA